MKYRIKKETKTNLPTFGKYKAVAVHQQEISGRQVVKEALYKDIHFEKDKTVYYE